MIVLDTNYLTFLEWKGSANAQSIYDELKRRNEDLTTTVVSFEEQMRGWMSYIARAKTVVKEIEAYQFLTQTCSCSVAWQFFLSTDWPRQSIRNSARGKFISAQWI